MAEGFQHDPNAVNDVIEIQEKPADASALEIHEPVQD